MARNYEFDTKLAELSNILSTNQAQRKLKLLKSMIFYMEASEILRSRIDELDDMALKTKVLDIGGPTTQEIIISLYAGEYKTDKHKEVYVDYVNKINIWIESLIGFDEFEKVVQTFKCLKYYAELTVQKELNLILIFELLNNPPADFDLYKFLTTMFKKNPDFFDPETSMKLGSISRLIITDSIPALPQSEPGEPIFSVGPTALENWRYFLTLLKIRQLIIDWKKNLDESQLKRIEPQLLRIEQVCLDKASTVDLVVDLLVFLHKSCSDENIPDFMEFLNRLCYILRVNPFSNAHNACLIFKYHLSTGERLADAKIKESLLISRANER